MSPRPDGPPRRAQRPRAAVGTRGGARAPGRSRQRADLTVPHIAARAGVTPSTIYRRWGDLHELLADVAVERLRPEAPPADLGNLREDLEHWAADFLEEMSSPPGRSYIRDALAGDPDGGNAGQCSAYAVEQVEAILARAARRGEHVPDTEIVMDHVVAPMMYRILFRPGLLEAQYARDLVATVFYRLMPLP